MWEDGIKITPELELLLLLTTKDILDDTSNLELDKLQKVIEKGIDWNKFLYNVIIHGFTQITYSSLVEINCNLIPASVINKLEEESKKRKIITAKILLETDKLTKLFESNNIRFFIVKGIPLALSIYKKLNVRESSDLDVLIHKDDLCKAIDVLTNANYLIASNQFNKVLKDINKPKTLYSYHHISYFHAARKVMIELHWKLDKEYLFLALNNPESIFYFDNLWRNRRQVTYKSNMRLDLFSQEDQLLYLVYHAAGHYYVRIKWLTDIYEIINMDSAIQWKDLLAKAKKEELLNSLALAIKLCSIYYKLDLKQIKDKISDTDFSKILESRKLNKVVYIICNFIIFNIHDLYIGRKNLFFTIKVNLKVLKCKLFICNKKRRGALLFLELRNMIKLPLRKMGILNYILKY